MSVTSFERRRKGTSGSCTSKRSDNTEYDIYAVYCEENREDVGPILDVLKQQKLDIYDPNEDALPNATLFKAWLEQGMYRSKITVLFLTKNFIRHNNCKLQAEYAVVRYTRTKGSHRVLAVMLQSCKVPKSLQHVHCVYAWKFREEPIEQYRRILKAIFAPKERFRRGSVLCVGVSAHAAKLAKTNVRDVQLYTETKKQGSAVLKLRHLIFNLNKVKRMLENCELKCTSKNCTFKCPGEKILDEFYEHVKVCKYQKVRCQFCRQTILRKNLPKHEQTTCPRRLLPCPNSPCVQKLTVKEKHKHSKVCSYMEIDCPNYKYGCRVVFARKDKNKHLEICEYEKNICEKCNNSYFRVDMETHICQTPRLDNNLDERFLTPGESVFKCYFIGCDYTGLKSDLDVHQMTCECRPEQCAGCGMRFPRRDMAWHGKQCDKIIECEQCHQLVPTSSKFTHDRWICNRQNIRVLCELCHTLVSNGSKEQHITSCVGENKVTQGSDTGATAISVTSEPVCHPHGSQNTRDFDYFQGEGAAISMETSYELEYDIHFLASIPDLCTTRSCLDDSDDSHGSFGKKWSPSKRKKWHELMISIERNQYDLRRAMETCKY